MAAISSRPSARIERKSAVEMMTGGLQIPGLPGKEAEVAVIGRDPAAVANPLVEFERPPITLVCHGEVATVLTQARESHQGIRLHPQVAGCFRERGSTLELRLGAVEPTEGEVGSADVAQEGGHADRVSHRGCAGQSATPDPE